MKTQLVLESMNQVTCVTDVVNLWQLGYKFKGMGTDTLYTVENMPELMQNFWHISLRVGKNEFFTILDTQR